MGGVCPPGTGWGVAGVPGEPARDKGAGVRARPPIPSLLPPVVTLVSSFLLPFPFWTSRRSEDGRRTSPTAGQEGGSGVRTGRPGKTGGNQHVLSPRCGAKGRGLDFVCAWEAVWSFREGQ